MSFFTVVAKDRISKEHYLIKIDNLINWKAPDRKLRGIHINEVNPKGGPKAYNNLSMFKAILLGQWHSLSDSGLEEALSLRLDFMLFTGFEIVDKFPDETTLCRFRNHLIKKNLHGLLFAEINARLEEHGIKVRYAKTALVDATIIDSSARSIVF